SARYCTKKGTRGERRQTVWKAALNADFGGADLPRLDGLCRDLLQVQEIGVGFPGPAAECAEFAAHKTDVGEIYIPIHHIGNYVAHEVAPQLISCNQQAHQIVPFSIRQGQALLAGEHGTVLDFEDVLERGTNLRRKMPSDIVPVK